MCGFLDNFQKRLCFVAFSSEAIFGPKLELVFFAFPSKRPVMSSLKEIKQQNLSKDLPSLRQHVKHHSAK